MEQLQQPQLNVSQNIQESLSQQQIQQQSDDINNDKNVDNNDQDNSNLAHGAIKKRRTKNESSNDRNYTCGCGKSYLSYPALYLHLKNKHNGKTPEGTQLPSNKQGARGRPKKEDSKDDQDGSQNGEDEGFQQLLSYLRSKTNNLVLEESKTNDVYDPNYFIKVLTQSFPKELFKNDREYLPIFNHLEILYKNLDQNDIDLFSQDELPPHNQIEQPQQQLKQDPQNELQVSLNGNGEATKLQNPSPDLLTKSEIKQISCNKIFAIFLYRISKYLSENGFREIAYFVCLYRNTLNKVGWNYLEQIKPELRNVIQNFKDTQKEFCEMNNGEYALEVCNQFIIDFLPVYLEECPEKNFNLLGMTQNHMKNAVNLTQFFCNWLFTNNYTNSKLMISNQETTNTNNQQQQ